jgi:hypothetical protein
MHKTIDFEMEVYGSIDLIGHVGKDDRLCVRRSSAAYATDIARRLRGGTVYALLFSSHGAA